MHVPPTALRGRRPRTTYLYEDTEHPDRITGALGEPWFTLDDRALLLGLEAYEATLCPGCGQPKELAWHAAVQASWDSEDAVCHACTTRAGHQVAYSRLTTSVTDEDLAALPPFVWGQTTTTPDPPSQR
jgi:hypothetical protein